MENTVAMNWEEYSLTQTSSYCSTSFQQPGKSTHSQLNNPSPQCFFSLKTQGTNDMIYVCWWTDVAMETNKKLTAPSHEQKTWFLTLFLLSLGWQKAKVSWVMAQWRTACSSCQGSHHMFNGCLNGYSS